MGKINISIYKKGLLSIIISIIMIILVSIISVKVTIEIDKDDKYDYIMKLIKEEKYSYALDELEDIQDFSAYSAKDKVKIDNYKKILTKYLGIDENSYIRELLKYLEGFMIEYKATLNEDIFKSLKKNLEIKITECKDKIILLNDERDKIKEIADIDLKEAQSLLRIFKEENPNEDVSEIEVVIENKKEEIAKEQTDSITNNEKVRDNDSNIVVNNDNINLEEIDNEASNNELKISKTNAAQNSSQLITVVSNGGSYAELAMWEKSSDGKWIEVDSMQARLGQNGMKYYGDIYEMDKCTPTGMYTLSEAFGINTNPGSVVPYRVLDGSEYWVDDENSEYYNTMQFGDANGRWNSAEHLSSWPGYYNYSLVIDYNRWPVVQGRSSAIFLHCDVGSYTYGCVAISENKLVNILKWLNPSCNPKIILDFTYDDIYNNY